jgi:outer membrane protein assembly factor BamB
VGENAVYTLDTKGNVAAYETASGNKKLWHSNVSPEKGKQFAGGGLASTGDVLFVTMGSDEVVALNAKDGKEIWRRQVGNIVRAAALAAGGGVFVITIDNHLYAMDARDGRIVWTHAGAAESLGVFGAASPVATAKLLVAPYSSGEIYGLNPSTGEEVWVGNLGYNAMETAGTALNDIDVTPVVSNGVLYAAGNAGVLYAVNADSSKRLWHQELGSIRGIWPAGEFLYVVGGTNEVVCLQASTGNIRWVAQLPRYTDEAAKKGKIIISGPVLAGEKLLVSASNGVLFSLSPYDGKIVHETKVPEGVLQSPVVSGGNVYVLSNKAILAVVQ